MLFADPNHEGATFSVLKSNILIAGPTTPGNNGYVPPEYPEEGDVKLVRVDSSLNAGSRIYLEGNYYEKHCGGAACLANPAAQWMLAKDYLAEGLDSVSALWRRLCNSPICRSRRPCRIRKLRPTLLRMPVRARWTVMRWIVASSTRWRLELEVCRTTRPKRPGREQAPMASRFWRSTGGH